MTSDGIVGYVLGGRYEIIERIGEGAFFSAFKAIDTRTNKAVALKLLKKNAPQPNPEEWTKTIGATFVLSHPAIAKVYDAGVSDGTPYFVAEYVRGISLKERIKRTAPLCLANAVDIAIAIAEALQYAHKNGFCHGDLRPHNVFTGPDEQVKVTDFAITKALSSQTKDTVLHAVHYAAPEVCEGKDPTPASDIYSLGIILYEMLTGTVPFEAETPLAVAMRHAKDPPTPPSHVNVGIPKTVDGIVLKCLQKDPERRYRVASSLLSDLRKVQESLRFGRPLNWVPADVDVAPKDSQDTDERDRHPFLTAISKAAMLVIGLALLALVITFWAVFYRAPKDVRVPSLAGVEAKQAEQKILKLGLTPHIVEQWDNDVPKGMVIKSYPPPGTEVKQGRDVTLWVSKGPEQVLVPDVTFRMDEATARKVLQESGLVVGSVEEQYSDTVKRGYVISQEPQGNTWVAPGTQVALVVSKGPAEVTLPELYSKTEREARRVLESLGLKVGEISREYNDIVPPGCVVSQDPPQYSVVPVGSEVSLVISRGPEPILAFQTPDLGTEEPVPDRRFRITVRVPDGPDPQQIQIQVTDQTGTRIAFDEPRSPGDRFTREILAYGDVVEIQVMSNGRVFFQRSYPRKGRR